METYLMSAAGVDLRTVLVTKQYHIVGLLMSLSYNTNTVNRGAMTQSVYVGVNPSTPGEGTVGVLGIQDLHVDAASSAGISGMISQAIYMPQDIVVLPGERVSMRVVNIEGSNENIRARALFWFEDMRNYERRAGLKIPQIATSIANWAGIRTPRVNF
jgi:hypothetical protein